MSMTEEELNSSLDRVKIQFMQRKASTFLTTILFSMKFEWTTQMKEPGIKVDGEHLRVHPEYWETLNTEQRISALAHEAWHVALEHHVNIGMPHIDKKRYQEAADQVVNNLLDESGHELPPEAEFDNKYSNMSTMEVYTQIIKDNPPDNDDNNEGGGDDGDGDGGDGNSNGGGINNDIENNTDGSESATQELRQQAEDMIRKAHTMAELAGEKSAGNYPGELDLKIDQMLNPKLDWRTILQNYMADFSKDDYSFQKPNRRFLPDFIMPGLHGEGLGHVGIAYDTSGSVYDSEFAAFMAESDDLREKLNPTLTSAVDFDTTIKHVHKLTADQPMKGLPFSGRGGTDLRCVFDHFSKPGNEPEVLLVFSDLECGVIHEDPGYPVIWICVNNTDATVKFGKLIHYETEQKDNSY